MNLWDKKLGLFLIALTFFGCEEEIGNISLTPENNLGIFFAETSLADNVGQVWAGGVSSSFSGRVMAGQYTDPVFGDITAKAYCDVSIAQANYDKVTITTSALKSMSMKVRIVDAAGTYATSDIQNLELYELVSPIENLETATSAKELELGELIGGVKIELNPDSINYVYEGTDTPGFSYDANGVYIYQAKFDFIGKYRTDFLQRFEEAVVRGAAVDEEDVDSVSYFLDQYIKGFAIVGKDENNAVVTFNLNDANSIINLKYTTLDDEAQLVDQEATFLLNSLKSFSNVTPNENVLWSNSLFDNISTINEVFQLSGDKAYFQSGSNLFMTLDFSNFKSIKDSLPNIIIQKADLTIGNAEPSLINVGLPSPIGYYVTSLDSIANRSLTNTPENTVLSDLPVSVGYNDTDKGYSQTIPLFLQAVIDDKTRYNYIVIGLNRSAQDNNLNSIVVNKNDIRLKFYYSIPDNN